MPETCRGVLKSVLKGLPSTRSGIGMLKSWLNLSAIPLRIEGSEELASFHDHDLSFFDLKAGVLEKVE